MIATVRVANPADSTKFMTINASDYRPLVHGPLWPEQAAGYVGLPPAPLVNYHQSERDFAGSLMLEVMEMQHRAEGKPEFGTLSPEKRMLALRDARVDFERSKRDYERRTQLSDQGLADLAKMGIVPGETPGHPVDGISGEPMKLDEATRERLANIPLGDAGDEPPVQGQGWDGHTEQVDPSLGAEPPPGLPPLGPDTAEEPAPATTEQPAPATPAPAADGKPSWAAGTGTPAPEAPAVNKGPGGKWYVMQGKEVLSEGFAKKADAEAELANRAK